MIQKYEEKRLRKDMVKRAIRRLLGVHRGSLNDKTLQSIIDDGVCPSDIRVLEFGAKKTYCDESKYDPMLEPYELCKKCWMDALFMGARGDDNEED